MAIPVNNKPIKIIIGKLTGVNGKKNLIEIMSRLVKIEKINVRRIKEIENFTTCFFKHRLSCKNSANDWVINEAKATPGIENIGKRSIISTILIPKINTKIRFIAQRLPVAVNKVP